MHHADITCRLTKAGFSHTDIANEEGVSVRFVGQVISGEKISHTVAKNIAKKTRLKINTLWPGRYKHDPRPLRRASKPKSRSRAA